MLYANPHLNTDYGMCDVRCNVNVNVSTSHVS